MSYVISFVNVVLLHAYYIADQYCL